MIDREIGLYNIEVDKTKRYFRYKRQLIFILIISVFVIVSVGVGIIKKNTVENGEVINQNVEGSELLRESYIDSKIYDEQYRRYVDNKYNFYCAFPKDYIVGESIGGGNRVALSSETGEAYLFIGATNNNLNLTARDVMNQYIAESGDAVSYKANGESWYAVSKEVDGVAYYRKCFVDETIRWFEFSVKKTSSEPTGEYIEYIEDNFRSMKTE